MPLIVYRDHDDSTSPPTFIAPAYSPDAIQVPSSVASNLPNLSDPTGDLADEDPTAHAHFHVGVPWNDAFWGATGGHLPDVFQGKYPLKLPDGMLVGEYAEAYDRPPRAAARVVDVIEALNAAIASSVLDTVLALYDAAVSELKVPGTTMGAAKAAIRETIAMMHSQPKAEVEAIIVKLGESLPPHVFLTEDGQPELLPVFQDAIQDPSAQFADFATWLSKLTPELRWATLRQLYALLGGRSVLRASDPKFEYSIL